MFNSRNPKLVKWLAPLATMLMLGMSASAMAQPDDSRAATDLYKQVVASPVRTHTDREDDARRKPLEFLEFARVQPGMKALDIATGGGYTAQLLALAVGKKGRVWAQGTQMRPQFEERMAQHPQDNIVPAVRPYDDPVPDGVSGLDLVTIIMNYHDIAYMPVDRAKMNQRLFEALKPGGHLVILDHSAKAGSGTADTRTLHRIDEAVVLDEMGKAGFKLEQESDFMRNPDDPREQPFFRTSIETDKFALRFIKP